MTGIGDEMLGAYIDGELSAEEQLQVEQALAADPALRRRLERLRRSDGLVRGAFAEIEGEPVPERLRGAADTSRGQRRPLRHRVAPPMLAAAAALVLGLALGYLLAPGPPPMAGLTAGALPAGGPIATALEHEPSGEVLETPELRIAPLATFRNTRGQYCREYQVRGAGGPAVRAVACRQQGVWQNRALFTPEDGDGYRQAGGTQRLRRLVAGPQAQALDHDAEARALASGWSSGSD